MRAPFFALAALLVFFSSANAQTADFTVSLPDPATHTFHVSLRVENLSGAVTDFKLPRWNPGYYRMLDYAKNLSGFLAEDAAGRALAWEKINNNTWRVAHAPAASIRLQYDVLANVSFPAQSFAGPERAYIAPPGLFLYPANRLNSAVRLQLQFPAGWRNISTGLEPGPRPGSFTAPDFDTLYDSPILAGNQETVRFDVRGVPHLLAIEDVPASIGRDRISADLKRIVEASVALMQDLPYRRYAFLLMGRGAGGIEHSNSASICFRGDSLTTESGYRNWLSFVAHEYFHHFNVKRIRPLALGPFDYDEETYTDLLWVSEGLTVYYEDILLVRAGLLTREQYLEKLRDALNRFENASGRHYQSASDSSLTTWGTSGVGNDRNTTISYYENGAMLGAMLDLRLRQATGNKKTLDDVMRALYRKYAIAARRGFTAAEFRAECAEAVDVLDYAWTNRDPDYARYFGYAGLTLEHSDTEAPGVYLGLNLQTRDGQLYVTSATPGSPAAQSPLLAGDRVAGLTPKALNDLLRSKQPGDVIRLRYQRGGQPEAEAEIRLAPNFKREYRFVPAAAPGAMQSKILQSWLGLGR